MTKTILVVDDNHEIKDVLVEFLSLAGYKVLWASNGADGVNHLADKTIDLIITDIVMPGIDGFELIKTIRAKQGLQSIPIIAFSATPQQGIMDRALQAGANAFVRKPASMEELLTLIEQLLDGGSKPDESTGWNFIPDNEDPQTI